MCSDFLIGWITFTLDGRRLNGKYRLVGMPADSWFGRYPRASWASHTNLRLLPGQFQKNTAAKEVADYLPQLLLIGMSAKISFGLEAPPDK